MPKDVIGIVIQLGAEGWEMIGSETWTLKHVSFGAVFKRPKP
jgi:hypothetical protein